MASEYAYFNSVGHTKVSSAGLVDEVYTRMHIIKLYIKQLKQNQLDPRGRLKVFGISRLLSIADEYLYPTKSIETWEGGKSYVELNEIRFLFDMFEDV